MKSKLINLKSALLASSLAFGGCSALSESISTINECRFRDPQLYHTRDFVSPFAQISKINPTGIELSLSDGSRMSVAISGFEDLRTPLPHSFYTVRVDSVVVSNKFPSATIHVDLECGF